MTAFRLNIVGVALLLVLALAAGCRRQDAPLEPLPLAELVPALEKAFTKSKPEVRNLTTQVIASVQAQNYPKAFSEINNALSQPDLTRDQITILARGSLTLNGLLQSAQSQGDPKAAQTLKHYEVNK